MIWIRNILKIFIILIIILVIVFTIFYFFPIGNKLANGVNQRNIAFLKIGMKKEEVIEILGMPLSQHETLSSHKVFVYGKSGFLTGTDMHILFKNKHMYLIYIGFWGASFYYCAENNCPKIGEPFHYNWFVPKI